MNFESIIQICGKHVCPVWQDTTCGEHDACLDSYLLAWEIAVHLLYSLDPLVGEDALKHTRNEQKAGVKEDF